MNRLLLVIALLAGSLFAGLNVTLFSQNTIITYPIGYIKAPRPSGRNGNFADVFRPFHLEPNSDLVILYPDGHEEILVDAPLVGAVADPTISFDGQWVYYSLFPDVVRINDYPVIPIVGSDIYKININTKQVIRLSNQQYTPNASGLPTLQVFNTSPTPLAGGCFAFTSSKNGFIPNKEYTPLTMQIFVSCDDGLTSELINPMTIGSSLHPFQLKDGRIAFSSFESQGLRDQRLWGYWSIWEDGTNWGPLQSAFTGMDVALHWAAQLTNGDFLLEGYYNANNEGFGAFWKIPTICPTSSCGFNSPNPSEIVGGVELTQAGTSGIRFLAKWPFLPKGATSSTPFTLIEDRPSPQINGVFQGKVTHPSGAPNNDLLLVYSPGPVNSNGVHLPYIDAGIYIAHNGFSNTPTDLQLVKNDPNFNEIQPFAITTYKQRYGVDEPARLPTNQNNGSVNPVLPPGTPFGIVGSASVYQRESFPGVCGNFGVCMDGLDAFYDPQGASNWLWQGSDAGLFTNDEIGSVRFVGLESRSVKAAHNWNVPLANERYRILGEAPINFEDGSFSAKIVANTPFLFQLLDKSGVVLATGQTWHQVRPGEMRVDCGGCHSHSKSPLSFATSKAATLPPTDLTLVPAHNVEFVRDVRPITQAKCASCHNATGPAPRLDSILPVTTGPSAGMPLDYAVLAANPNNIYGGKTISRIVGFNLSQWNRACQARRSVLYWTIAGKRMDGFTNDKWPTESVPGDISTFPVGANIALADLNFRIDHSALVTNDERKIIASWLDTCSPLDSGNFFWDETRPTLSIVNSNNQIIIGAADAYKGLDLTTFSVKVNDVVVMPTAITGSRWTVPFVSPISKVVAFIKDNQGNPTILNKTLTVQGPTDPCIITPLKITAIKWPTGDSGNRSGSWNSGSFVLVERNFISNPMRFFAKDNRGCTITINK